MNGLFVKALYIDDIKSKILKETLLTEKTSRLPSTAAVRNRELVILL